MVKNGNYYLNIYNNKDGMRISERFLEEGLNECIPEYPEMVDIKITNECKVGCKWCYQSSVRDDKATAEDLPFLKEIIDQLPSYTELAIGGGDVLEYDFINDLVDITSRFTSRNFTINKKSLRPGNVKIVNRLTTIWNHATAIGISIDKPSDVSYVKTFCNTYGLDFSKVCFHVIPELTSTFTLTDILTEISRVESGVLLLGYKSFGRGSDYKVDKFSREFIVNLLNAQTCYIKVDTKFSKDYMLDGINIHEGEFSCNVDVPLRTVSPSSWRNKEQFYDGDFKEAFQKIRESEGFKKYNKDGK